MLCLVAPCAAAERDLEPRHKDTSLHLCCIQHHQCIDERARLAIGRPTDGINMLVARKMIFCRPAGSVAHAIGSDLTAGNIEGASLNPTVPKPIGAAVCRLRSCISTQRRELSVLPVPMAKP